MHAVATGSERQRKTGTGNDAKLSAEARAINSSLTALSTVFVQLADSTRHSINCRGNLLTEALQVRSC